MGADMSAHCETCRCGKVKYDYGTDNGPACKRCSGTIYGYTVREERRYHGEGGWITGVDYYATAFCCGCHDASAEFHLGSQPPHDWRDVKSCHVLLTAKGRV